MSAPVAATDLRVLREGRAILDGFSLAAEPGELLTVLGPNGAGKSTALKAMAGVLTPEGGTVAWAGRNAADWDRLDLAKAVSYLPQQFRSHWDLTVAELVALGGTRGQGFGWLPQLASTRPPAPDLVAALELETLLPRRYATLSGGEQARAAFAASIAAKPALLLADEPAASLDIAHQLRLMRLMRDLAGQATVIVVLHEINLAARFADRIAVVDQGRCVAIGPTAEILHSDVLDRVFETEFERATVAGHLTLVAR